MDKDVNTLVSELKRISGQIADILPQKEMDADVNNWLEAKMMAQTVFRRS